MLERALVRFPAVDILLDLDAVAERLSLLLTPPPGRGRPTSPARGEGHLMTRHELVPRSTWECGSAGGDHRLEAGAAERPGVDREPAAQQGGTLLHPHQTQAVRLAVGQD